MRVSPFRLVLAGVLASSEFYTRATITKKFKLMPFSIAWMELRVTLAKMLYTFDLELEDPELEWIGEDFANLPQYSVWIKPKLNIKAQLAGK